MKLAAIAILGLSPFVSLAQSSDNVLSFQAVALLRAYDTSTLGATVPEALTAGYYVAGDGGGNRFYWSAISTAADNGGTVIKPITSTIGRWIAVNNTPLNVKAFGALGDGVTNDTANIDKAIAVANAGNLTLEFPSGTYLITAGGLTNDIKCNVHGPQAILQAVNYTSGISPLVTINYTNAENTAARTFELREMIGAGSATPGSGVGAGLYVKNASASRFVIGNLKFFAFAVYLDGSSGGSTGGGRIIGVNDFHIEQIIFNNIGVLLNSGPNPDLNQTESNRFFLNYLAVNSTAGILIGNGAYPLNATDENVFDILSLELNIDGAHGIVVQGPCGQRNTFTVHSILGGAIGTGQYIVADGTDNVFHLIRPDWSLITSTGNNIFDEDTFAKDGSGRSRINGSAPPTAGHWRAGDMVWNNTGYAPDGWRCSVAGTPGTWEVMGGILSRFDSTNLPVYVMNEDRAQLRFSQVTNFPGTGNFNRVLDIMASGDANTGSWIRLLTATPNTAPAAGLWQAPSGGVIISSSAPTTDPGAGNFKATGTITTPTLNAGSITQDSVTAVSVFSGGWGNFGGSQELGGYYKDRSGRVWLQGALTGGSTARATVMFTLPVGYRPSYAQIYAVSSAATPGTDIFGSVEISPLGEVKFIAGGNTYISLAGISFRP